MRVALPGFLLAAVCVQASARPRPAANHEAPVRLAWYTSLPALYVRKLAAEFVRRHPGISLDWERSDLLFEPGGETGAHWEKADVVTDPAVASRCGLAGSGAFARLDVPPAGRSPALCPWVRDPRGCYVYTHAARIPIMFLRRAVSDQDAPESLAALAQPRWKGKVALPAPGASFTTDCLYRFVADSPALGFAWLERMRDNDVILLDSPAALWEAMASGARPVMWGLEEVSHEYRKMISGTFVGLRLARDGSFILLSATAINRRAPHPAAARQFVAWLSNPAAQSFMSKNHLSFSLLKGACERLERRPVCGRKVADSPAETEEFRRKVWKALLGDGRGGHIPR